MLMEIKYLHSHHIGHTCMKMVLLCTLDTVVIIKNYNESSVADALETPHILIGKLGFICTPGFDAQKVADFPQHQIENFLII